MPDPSLVAAYRRACYVVFVADGELVLRIGAVSAELDALLGAADAVTAAYLTASNPGSMPLPPDQNRRRHKELRAAVEREGFSGYPGEGRDPEGNWPPEQSLLVAGIERDVAATLAGRFGQYAFVWLERGRPCELVLTPP